MFHSLIPIKKGNVKCKTFYIKRVGNRPLFNVQKKCFLVDLFWTCFDHSSMNKM